jgi:hypothetical protein
MPALNHMDIVRNNDLEGLLTEREGPCLSLFMPTERMGTETQQNPIRLKNLITQAKVQLSETGLSSSAQRELLAPIQALQPDAIFWQQQSEGLAIFAAPGTFSGYRLPLAFDELVVVGSCFHIKPLLPLFSRDQRFFILTLSLNQVRLFQATHYSLGEIPLEGVATGMTEVLQFDDPEKETLFHISTNNPASVGSHDAIFHGHAPDEDRKSDILRFFRQVNQGVVDFLGRDAAPLVLVAVDYLHPLYRQANTYPHLASRGVAGNPQTFASKEFHARAWEIVRSRLDVEREQALDRYQSLVGQNTQASGNLKTILPAAFYGRVDTLFVARGIQLWGTLDPQTGDVRLHHEASPNNEDLLDLAAAQTLMKGGSVYVVEPDDMPDKTSIAAVFRY